MKGMISFLRIDAENRTFEECSVAQSTGLQAMQKAVGGWLEAGSDLANGDCLYVDEEAMLKGPRFFFRIGNSRPYAGNGVVSRINGEGATVSAKSKIASLEKQVKWLTPAEALLIAKQMGY
jgi:hypothetical protein